MQTMFTEVLSKFEWLRFMDHLFSNDTAFLSFFVAAYNVFFQKTLRSTQSLADVEVPFNSHHNGMCHA